jgi:hypothetical protein
MRSCLETVSTKLVFSRINNVSVSISVSTRACHISGRAKADLLRQSNSKSLDVEVKYCRNQEEINDASTMKDGLHLNRQ